MDHFQEPTKAIQYQARRANGAWVSTEVVPMFANLRSPPILRRLALLGDSPYASGDELNANLLLMWELVCNTAGARTWSMLTHTSCLPEKFAGILDEDIAAANQCMAEIRNIASAITEAMDVAQSADFPEADVMRLRLCGCIPC